MGPKGHSHSKSKLETTNFRRSRGFRAPPSREESPEDGVDVQLLQVRVLLPRADKHDGLPRLVAHAEGGAHLVIDCVEFGEDDAVDALGCAGRQVRHQRLEGRAGTGGEWGNGAQQRRIARPRRERRRALARRAPIVTAVPLPTTLLNMLS